ncbi:polysaccharide biosynthesis protein [Rhodopseudomonas sp. BR0M22]|nr:polysaccharide biosynthesis protein [Rhodopseudomonas sp. BR0M22]
MKNPNMVLYFGSRTIAAIGNFLSVAVFARLIGPSEYGAYILMFAWAIIIYGFGTQWMKFAYFGVYRASQEGILVASYIRLVAVAVVAVTVVLTGLGELLSLDFSFTTSLISLFAGMTIYEAALEVSRTRLQVKTVALSMVCRTLFVFLLGYLALELQPTAVMLAFGVSVGHLLAAIPSLLRLQDFRGIAASRAPSVALIRYGWPLILSFGVFALGQSIDRFLVSHYVGNEVLGPYGVVADMMRQSYMVVGESIALALITVAKRYADEGRQAESDAVMRSSFRACVVAAAFGATFFVLFGNRIFIVLLGANFAGLAHGIIPFFAVAFGFMMLRSFYFAQVIYFTNAAFLELLIAVVFVATSAVFAVMLTPQYGSVGGATSLMVGHGAAFVVSAVIGRKLHTLPIDWKAAIGIFSMAGILLGTCLLLSEIVVSPMLLVAIQASLFAAALMLTLSLADLLRLVLPERKPLPNAQ